MAFSNTPAQDYVQSNHSHASRLKANGSALSSGLADLYDVTADANQDSCDLEIFIASV